MVKVYDRVKDVRGCGAEGGIAHMAQPWRHLVSVRSRTGLTYPYSREAAAVVCRPRRPCWPFPVPYTVTLCRPGRPRFQRHPVLADEIVSILLPEVATRRDQATKIVAYVLQRIERFMEVDRGGRGVRIAKLPELSSATFHSGKGEESYYYG